MDMYWRKLTKFCMIFWLIKFVLHGPDYLTYQWSVSPCRIWQHFCGFYVIGISVHQRVNYIGKSGRRLPFLWLASHCRNIVLMGYNFEMWLNRSCNCIISSNGTASYIFSSNNQEGIQRISICFFFSVQFLPIVCKHSSLDKRASVKDPILCKWDAYTAPLTRIFFYKMKPLV